MSARRRERAARRAQAVLDLDVRWAFRLDRTPLYAVAVASCSCGWVAWVMPGATVEDHEAHLQASLDHSDVCATDWWDDVA